MRSKHIKLGNLLGRTLTAALIVLLSVTSLHGSKNSGSTLISVAAAPTIPAKALAKISPDLLNQIQNAALDRKFDVIVRYSQIPGHDQYEKVAKNGGGGQHGLQPTRLGGYSPPVKGVGERPT